jgi:hypothetical protein
MKRFPQLPQNCCSLIWRMVAGRIAAALSIRDTVCADGFELTNSRPDAHSNVGPLSLDSSPAMVTVSVAWSSLGLVGLSRI